MNLRGSYQDPSTGENKDENDGKPNEMSGQNGYDNTSEPEGKAESERGLIDPFAQHIILGSERPSLQVFGEPTEAPPLFQELKRGECTFPLKEMKSEICHEPQPRS